MQKVLIIINPLSGHKQGKKYLADILEELSNASLECCVYFTKQKGDAEKTAYERSKDFDEIICIGGDGTFNEVASGILSSGENTVIGYIPAGSTNDFANSLKISPNILKACSGYINGDVNNVDMGSFNGRYFSYIASFGIFTKTSYATPQDLKNILGHLAYVLEGVKELTNIKPERLKFEIEGEIIEDDYIFGAISNSTSVGGILTLDPDVVDLNDGYFEIMLIKAPKNILELNECVNALSTKNYNSKMITFRTAKTATIYANKDMSWTLDGEYQEGAEIIKVDNIHNAIKVKYTPESKNNGLI